MGEVKKVETEKGSEKLSYDKLRAAAAQLSAENNQLVNRLRMVDNMMTRLNCLFKVMEHPDMYKESFVKSCAEEIEDILTLPEEEIEETKE